MHVLRVRLSRSGAGRGLLLFGILLDLAACQGPPAQGGEGPLPDPVLRFRPDGTFTIVHFTDTQDDQEMDPRTVRLIEAVLDDQRPDLVVFTGDNVRSGPGNPDEVHQGIDAFARPVDRRGIPWLVTFGNHDEDHTARSGVDKAGQLEYYVTFPYNVTAPHA